MWALLLGLLAAPGLAADPPPPARGPAPLPGDLPLDRAAECADLRRAAWDGFLSAPPRAALSAPALVEENAYGRWRRSAQRSGDALYLLFTAGRGEAFPLYAQGSWIVKRSLSDGAFLQAKIFLKSDPGTFIRIYPAGERSRMDLLLYGAVLRREVALPFSFQRVLSLSLAEILQASADSVDWELFSPRPGLYAGIGRLVESIRDRLPGLRYAEDGALDAEGRPVFIATGLPQPNPPGLNCSGFAKWIVDGLYRPLKGSWLDPRALALRDLGLRGSSFTAAREASEDPFFGLDWTRNLARALGDWRPPGESGPSGAGEEALAFDVRINPFALFASSAADPVNGGSSYLPYPAYESDSGYEVRGLKALLYILAQEEPGNFYLASLSRDEGGLRKHFHVAALFPYFLPGGEFQVAVFESAEETGLETLISRGPGHFAHLVRLSPRGAFEPPPLP